MKHIYLSTLLCITALATTAQQTTESWENQGTIRQYIQYVPGSYNASNAVPLVIALHGMGDNMTNFSGIGMQLVADTANFIVVYPQALKAFNPQLVPFFGPDSITAWNSGAGAMGLTLSPDVSDVEFINALIDTLSVQFNIDQSRIYATGFSMGAFMTNRLACELPRIAAIASVAGTVGGLLDCQPGRSVPACHFHGTADTQVGYGTPDGAANNLMGLNVSDWITFWTGNNACGEVTLSGALPDMANDGYTVDYLEYAGCADNSRVVHYKVYGAEHVWLGPNEDIFYTREIWRFFLGLSPLSVGMEEQATLPDLSLYPNPANDLIFLSGGLAQAGMVSIVGADGRILLQTAASQAVHGIDISGLATGAYLLQVVTDRGVLTHRFMKMD
ncbi:MAG: T9SS type A sorting domain-containing protein [Flavobacteriales bacterium]|nr:T9SS type A sorting domain-containing protein [Flavobacteriales bacterium]